MRVLSVGSTAIWSSNSPLGANADYKSIGVSSSLYGIHFSVRHGDQTDATIILTALAADLTGNKEVLARRSCAEESKEGWLSLLQDVRMRGATKTRSDRDRWS